MANTRVTAADVQISGTLDMRTSEIIGLSTDLTKYPLTDDQAVTKKYVDTTRSNIISNLPTSVNNGEY